ncbi:MAG: hypothetical protein GTO29_08705 [Candidatus Latescibacteria bacterium]|nr:hypothetical protein [Candidatus Latescibacterota bacterium]NIO56242.1 hypothetical protein [Candidatus Latescibacterota bacterium]
MDRQISPSTAWVRLASITGLASILCYFAAAFLPLPDMLARLLVFAFGPLLCVAFLGLYRYMSVDSDGPVLQVACLFGILAGVLVTTMLVVQVGNNMAQSDMLAAADSDTAKEAIRTAGRAVNRVQYLLDVVWDIFICVSTVLLAIVLWSHPRFGKIWGAIGFMAGLVLLVLNLHSFPYPPAEAGSVDLGPLVALWMLGVFVRMLLLIRKSG